MTKRKQSNVRLWISRLITLISLGVFIYAAYNLIDIFLDYYKNRQLMGEMQELFYEEEDVITGDTIRPGFYPLLEQNEDVVGWIKISGTQIDYPILQAEDNFFYLTRNFYYEESRAGSIYMDYRNNIRLTDERNVIVYGHRMKDGSMFQQLTKYLDKEFFDTHRKIQFDTLYESYEAEVFAVYNTLTDFNYIQTEFTDDAEFAELLEQIKAKSKFKSDVEVTTDDIILTLSTCDYQLDREEGRLVVQAKLIKKEA